MTYKVEKDWEHVGLRCVVIMTEMGHRCGYVGVPEEHFLHGVGYNQHCDRLNAWLDKVWDKEIDKDKVSIIALCFSETRLSPEILFSVHGGITFSDNIEDYPVPHDNLWWFGFDCAHHGDTPDPEVYPNYPLAEFGTVRTLDYCINECNSLAEQLINAQFEYNNRQYLLNKQF